MPAPPRTPPEPAPPAEPPRCLAEVLERGLLPPHARGAGVVRALRDGLRLAAAAPRRRRQFFLWTAAAAALGAWEFAWIAPLLPPADFAAALATTLGWFALFAFLAYAQTDLVRRPDGTPRDAFQLPNGLTLLRMLLAPVLGVLAAHATHLQPHGHLLFWPVVALVVSDLLDGQIARRCDALSEWGRMADPCADIFVWSWFAGGLWAGGLVEPWFALVVLFRFSGLLVGAFTTWGLGRPVRVAPTLPGRAVNLAVSIYLPGRLAAGLVWPHWLHAPWLQALLWITVGLLAVNLVYWVARWLGLLPAAAHPPGGPP